MDYDDNFEMSSTSSHSENKSPPRSSTNGTNSSKDPNPDHLVEMVLRKLGQTYRPPYRQQPSYGTQPSNGPYVCGACAGPHRTENCTSYVTGAYNPPTRKWCQACSWNTTHVTQDCNHIARLARKRGTFGAQLPRQGYAQQESAKPVLGTQPPPPGTVPARYVDVECHEPSKELVQTNTYYQEYDYDWRELPHEFADRKEPSHDCSHQVETNSMMLVGPMSSPYPPRRSAPMPQGVKCYDCGGDHYVKDCPNRLSQSQRQRLPPIERYCVGCCQEHFPKECPSKPKDVINQGPKTSMNYIGIVPSPSNSESETERVSLNVVTRAQTKQKQPETKMETSKSKSKKRTKKRTRSKGSKKSKQEPQQSKESLEQPSDERGETEEPRVPKEDKVSSKPSSGGSMIVDKVNEPLQAALDAHDSRITPLTVIPKKLQEYPNPREEKVRLAVHQQLIRDTQTMLEGLPQAIKRGPVSKKPDLETIPEEASSRECNESIQEPLPQEQLCRQSITRSMTLEGILEVDKCQAKELWEAVHRHAVENWSDGNVSPPFSEMNLEQPK